MKRLKIPVKAGFSDAFSCIPLPFVQAGARLFGSDLLTVNEECIPLRPNP